jgi:hypothetical protein
LLQKLKAAVQWRPVVSALSQSALPHAQLASFAREPSVIVQSGGLEHVLVAAVHTIPVLPAPLPSQTAAPHAQLASLAEEPLVSVHAGILLQKLKAAVLVQWRPVVLALSQFASPHAQLAAFAEVPSVIVHAGILLHLLMDAMQCIPFVHLLVHNTFLFPQMQGV